MLNQADALDLAFQALADPSRRRMIDQLSRGAASVSDLARPLAMTMAAVMQHLKVLESSGLVRTEKVGRVRTCRLDAEALTRAEQWIGSRRTAWDSRLNRLEDFLAQE